MHTMALNFNLEDVRKRLGEDKWNLITTNPHTRGTANEKWHTITDMLIWMTMAVDLGEITEDNLDEWEFRYGLLQGVNGPDFGIKGVDFYLTREDLENHIGLSTNVGTISRTRWLTEKIAKKDLKLKTNPDGKSGFQIIEDAYEEEKAKFQ